MKLEITATSSEITATLTLPNQGGLRETFTFPLKDHHKVGHVAQILPILGEVLVEEQQKPGKIKALVNGFLTSIEKD